MKKSEPVFLQALWRTGSTYFWNKFRTRAELRCYYEPLHEEKGRQREELDGKDHNTLGLRHPEITMPMSVEYPWNENGIGVQGFQKRFPFERYYLAPEEPGTALKGYLQGLIDHADLYGQRAMFQPNRAILRGGWMARNFPGTHIYLNRDFKDIFHSYYSFNGTESYFLRSYAHIIKCNAETPLFQTLANRLELAEEAEKKSRQFLRDMVAFFWVTALAQATRYADIIIDSSMMMDKDYRKNIEKTLTETTGISLSFDDFRTPKHGTTADLKISKDMKDLICSAVKLIQPDWQRLLERSPAQSTLSFLKETTKLEAI